MRGGLGADRATTVQASERGGGVGDQRDAVPRHTASSSSTGPGSPSCRRPRRPRRGPDRALVERAVIQRPPCRPTSTNRSARPSCTSTSAVAWNVNDGRIVVACRVPVRAYGRDGDPQRVGTGCRDDDVVVGSDNQGTSSSIRSSRCVHRFPYFKQPSHSACVPLAIGDHVGTEWTWWSSRPGAAGPSTRCVWLVGVLLRSVEPFPLGTSRPSACTVAAIGEGTARLLLRSLRDDSVWIGLGDVPLGGHAPTARTPASSTHTSSPVVSSPVASTSAGATSASVTSVTRSGAPEALRSNHGDRIERRHPRPRRIGRFTSVITRSRPAIDSGEPVRPSSRTSSTYDVVALGGEHTGPLRPRHARPADEREGCLRRSRACRHPHAHDAHSQCVPRPTNPPAPAQSVHSGSVSHASGFHEGAPTEPPHEVVDVRRGPSPEVEAVSCCRSRRTPCGTAWRAPRGRHRCRRRRRCVRVPMFAVGSWPQQPPISPREWIISFSCDSAHGRSPGGGRRSARACSAGRSSAAASAVAPAARPRARPGSPATLPGATRLRSLTSSSRNRNVLSVARLR